MSGFSHERVEVERRVIDALGLAGQNVRSTGFYFGPHEPPSVTLKVYLSPEQVTAIFNVPVPAPRHPSLPAFEAPFPAGRAGGGPP